MGEHVVGVLGCGGMGSGIVQVVAEAGCPVVVREVSSTALDEGLARIDRFMAEGVRRRKVTEEQKTATRRRIRGTTEWEDLASCSVVIEAVFEDMEVKHTAMRSLSSVLAPGALVATNTSSLSVTEIAAAYARPERVVGMHFFNPAPLMKLVEVVRAVQTDEASFAEALEFVRALGKEPVRTKDSPGFLVNYLFIPYVNQTIQAFDDGLVSREDLDSALELGLGYPMGPLKLVDLIGLDVHLHASEALYQDTRERRFAPPPLLRRMVKAGRLGRKVKHGFYTYSG